MKRNIAILLLSLLLVCLASNALADTITPFASTLISSTSVSLSASGTTLTATANISAKTVCDTLGFSYIRIQVLQGTQWVTVRSVTSQYKTSALTHSYSLSYTGTSGNVYRATAGFYAQDGDITETRSGTSSSSSI